MLMPWLRGLLLVPVLIAPGFLMACGGDGDEGGHMAEPGVVGPKPADATDVRVTLREWAIAVGQPSAPPGKVYFLVENAGPEHPHELVIIRSELGPLALPFEDNKVPKGKVDIVDEIEEFSAHSSASITVELRPGKYLLICNITEEENDIGSHYKKGMVAPFTVQ